MNINEYISSGIIESYVLGLASAEERAEFEKLCKEYPELVAARNAFELSLEKQAFENAPQSPASAREGFMNFINQESLASKSKIITMENSTSGKSSGPRWLAAASVILLLVAGYFAYQFYNQTKELKNANRDLEAKLKTSDSVLNRIAEEKKVMSDPKVTVVNLVGLAKAPASSASIYWDSTSANVWLLVKNLPQLPSDKQYQLWAIIEGKPKNLGLFDPQAENKVMLKMNNTQKADAFAITIENRGNTGGPNLEELQTMGKPKL